MSKRVLPEFRSISNLDKPSGLEIAFPHETGDQALYERAFTKLFPQGHPEYAGDGDITEDMDYPWNCDNDDEKPVFVVLGRNLGRENEEITGFAYVDYMTKSQTGLLVYAVIDKDASNKDAALRFLTQQAETATDRLAATRKETLRATFIETRASDIEKYEKIGAVRVPVSEFVQPVSFNDAEEEVQQRFPALMALGRMPSLSTTQAFLGSYYDICETPHDNPCFIQMAAELSDNAAKMTPPSLERRVSRVPVFERGRLVF